MKLIGILGGMGPEASAYFNKLIIDICQKDYNCIQDSDFPGRIIYDVPVKGLDETGIVDDENVLNSLKKGIEILEKDNVDFIVIDCNTVHYYIDKLREFSKKPIISIIESVLEESKKEQYKVLGIVGTRTTVNKAIYDKVFNKYKIRIMHPTEEEENIITSTILNVMGNKYNQNDVKNLNKIINRMKDNGAEAVIIGCTELSIITENNKFNVPLIDSMGVLARASVRYAMCD